MDMTYDTNDIVEPAIGKGMTYQEKILLLGRERNRKIAEQKELAEQRKLAEYRRKLAEHRKILELIGIKEQKKQEIIELIESQYSNLNNMIEKQKLAENKSARQIIAEMYNGMPVRHDINGLSCEFNELLKRYYEYEPSYIGIKSYITLQYGIYGAEACEWLLKNKNNVYIHNLTIHNENLSSDYIYRPSDSQLERLMEKDKNSKYTKFSLNNSLFESRTIWLDIKALEDIDIHNLDSILMDLAKFSINGSNVNLPHFQVKLDVIKDDIVIDQHISEFIDKIFTVLLMRHLFNNTNQG